ncbi:MAG: outer membrane protein assembly factor BamE [Gammaproteobacteria bacterium]
MHPTKSLIAILLISSLHLSGCETASSLLYRIDVNQGNLVNQDMVNRLRPGMNRRQVAYLLGTPTLVDTFNSDRWDYMYLSQPGSGDTTRKHLAVHFDGDQLARIEGDWRPEPGAELKGRVEKTVAVPLREREPKGFFDRVLDTVGLGED